MPYLEYAINKDYIAEVLCINKEKPELMCGGICYLDQKLTKIYEEENEPKNTNTPPKEIKQNTFYYDELSFANVIEYIEVKKKFNIQNNVRTTDLKYKVPTPPPQVLC